MSSGIFAHPPVIKQPTDNTKRQINLRIAFSNFMIIGESSQLHIIGRSPFCYVLVRFGKRRNCCFVGEFRRRSHKQGKELAERNL
jgi:hypothetical protein